MNPARLLLLACLLPATLPALADPASVVRDTEIRQSPRFDSVAIARVAEGQKLEAHERRLGWTRVRDDKGNEGWVRMLLLRRTPGAGVQRQGDSGILEAINVARTGSSGRQVTTGVRGLDAEELKNAKPNPAELKKAQGFAASRDDAAKFAAQGELQSQRVPYPKEGG